MKRIFAVFLALGLAASLAYAHNGMEHVMGTVAAISSTSITVTATSGKSQTVLLNSDTKYARMDKAAMLKDVKVGDHVVIHATKKGAQLIAATVKVGTEAKKSMGGMKMDGNASPPQPKGLAPAKDRG